jgi:low temperature requirement protein LtrA
VVAVTQVSALLLADHGFVGLLRALVVFVPIYWTWVGTTIQANMSDISAPRTRIAIFTVALGGLFLAMAVPDAFGGSALLFALAYWISRCVLGILQRSWRHRTLNPVTFSMTITGPIFVVGALVPEVARLPLWGVAAFLDLFSLVFFRKRLTRMIFDAGHLTERFGLFVLIALGETVVAVSVSALHVTGGSTHAHLNFVSGVAVVGAFVLACALWWVYFQFAADAMRFALATAQVQLDITRRVLSYGHLAFIGSIIATAVGLHEAVGNPSDRLGWSATALLFGGVALYLAAFGYTRWFMFRQVATTRLGAAAACLVLLPLCAFLPALAALSVLAACVAVLNVVEYRRVLAERGRAAAQRGG